MDRMTAALPWTVKVLHRSSEVRIVDARGRLVAIVKTKVYRIGTSTDPTTTFTLPRAGVWVGTVSLMESTGAHSRSGRYRICWDTGSLQSAELIGTQWTVGASAPTVLGLAVSNAGVVTVTSTAGSAAWDIQYHFACEGNYRYADF